MDLYQILETPRNSTKDEIKKAYHKKALTTHPDKNTGNESAFKELKHAYEVLSNPNQKAIYDNLLLESSNKKSNIKVPDVIHNVSVSLKDIYAGKRFDINFERENQCIHCYNVRTTNLCMSCNGLGVNLMIGRLGPITHNYHAICTYCSGFGRMSIIDSCSMCNGKKSILSLVSFQFDLPIGVPSASKMVVSEEGNYNPHTNKRSDLIIVISCDVSFGFQRMNNVDLKKMVKVGYLDVVYGTVMDFENLDGSIIKVELKGIKNGGFKIIQNKGMPNYQSNRRGDLILEFIVDYPPIELFDKYKSEFIKYCEWQLDDYEEFNDSINSNRTSP